MSILDRWGEQRSTRRSADEAHEQRSERKSPHYLVRVLFPFARFNIAEIWPLMVVFLVVLPGSLLLYLLLLNLWG